VITLSADGNSYTGSFVLQATNTSGDVTARIIGATNGTRITLATTAKSLLWGWLSSNGGNGSTTERPRGRPFYIRMQT